MQRALGLWLPFILVKLDFDRIISWVGAWWSKSGDWMFGHVFPGTDTTYILSRTELNILKNINIFKNL